MSLLQKASIITTPTAYAEDYLYSIKPAYAINEVVVNRDVVKSKGKPIVAYRKKNSDLETRA